MATSSDVQRAIDVIDSCSHPIAIAVSIATHPEIYAALMRAKAREVEVKFIIDFPLGPVPFFLGTL